MTIILKTAIAAGSCAFSLSAHGAFIVDSNTNSSSGGVGLGTVALTSGQFFSVSADANDLWNAGALPRWSNADGLVADLFATGSDESGEIAGTKIGMSFGSYSQGGLTAPFGSLVGQIDAGPFFFLGSNFNGTASSTGTLNLFYWDSNRSDNTENIAVRVNVPDGGTTCTLFGLSILGVAALSRKLRRA